MLSLPGEAVRQTGDKLLPSVVSKVKMWKLTEDGNLSKRFAGKLSIIFGPCVHVNGQGGHVAGSRPERRGGSGR